MNTLRALEEGLENFAGCAVVISHDRWFLDRIATHILAFEGDSQVVFFEGSYSEYEENKRKRLGDTTPHRIKYRTWAPTGAAPDRLCKRDRLATIRADNVAAAPRMSNTGRSLKHLFQVANFARDTTPSDNTAPDPEISKKTNI